jgi:hypothetical protein
MIADGTITNTDINASAAIALSKLATGALPTAITVASANIVDGTIVNADISTAAAIAHSKLASMTGGQVLLGNASSAPTATTVTGDVTISSTGVTDIASGAVVNADINASAAIAHSKLAAITAGRVLLGNASNVPTATALTGDVTVSSAGVTAIKSSVGLTGTPTAPTATAGSSTTQIATTAFVSSAVDAAKQGLTYKAGCRVATTTNLTLSGTQTIDGVTVAAGDRVLVKNQTTASQNGVYVVSATAWTRATDFDATADLSDGAFVFVKEGTANADTGWVLSTDGAITVGTTALTFVQFSGAGTFTAGTGLQLDGTQISLAALPSANLLVGSASNVATATAVTGDVTISNTGVTSIGASRVTNAMLAGSIADSKLSTISTAGKVSNSATTATSANTASAIVARNGSGNFTAGTITAALSGNASTATTLQNARTINGVSFNGSANISVTANTGTSLTFNNAGSGGASGSTFNGGTALTVSHNTVGAPSTTGAGASGSWGISVTGSSASCTGNAATATTLATARTLWGQSFNGSANITGNLTSVGNITGTSAITIAAGGTDQSITLTPTGTGVVNAPTFNATSTTAGGFQGIAADSAENPSFTWTGNLTTGVYRSGTNQVGITTAGTPAAVFQTTHILYYRNLYLFPPGDVAADGTTTTRASNQLFWRGKYWNGTSSINTDWNAVYVPTDTSGSGEWRLRNGTTNRLVVNNSGNVTAATFTGALSGNATTASTLATARTLWGQSFNGAGNITGDLTSVGNITGTGAITLTSGGTNQPITITTSGTGSINLDTGTGAGSINLKPGADPVRIWDDTTTNYFNIVTGTLSANRNLTLPNANVTLVSGTMVPTTGTGATGSWGISVTGNAATATLASNINRQEITSDTANIYRVLLGSNNNTAGSSGTFVVTDETRLTYRPSTDTLTVGTVTATTFAGTATNCSRSVVAGSGMTGGGALSGNVTVTLGTPGTITDSTTNSVTSTSHTHNLNINAILISPGIAVGAYHLLRLASGSENLGELEAGSNLYRAKINSSGALTAGTTTVSGTYRLQSNSISANEYGLWQRVA